MHRFSIVLEAEHANEIASLSDRYGITGTEVLRQVIEVGLENIDAERAR
ncbi:MAG: CopG family transcriptional regulator [Natronomonas sp.]